MCLETVGVETYGHKGESVGLVTITFRLVRYYCSAVQYYSRVATFWVISKDHDAAPT